VTFITRLFMTEGDLDGVDVLMKDEEGKSMLRITQRLRLDQVELLYC
jgi:RNA-binding protein 15